MSALQQLWMVSRSIHHIPILLYQQSMVFITIFLVAPGSPLATLATSTLVTRLGAISTNMPASDMCLAPIRTTTGIFFDHFDHVLNVSTLFFTNLRALHFN